MASLQSDFSITTKRQLKDTTVTRIIRNCSSSQMFSAWNQRVKKQLLLCFQCQLGALSEYKRILRGLLC